MREAEQRRAEPWRERARGTRRGGEEARARTRASSRVARMRRAVALRTRRKARGPRAQQRARSPASRARRAAGGPRSACACARPRAVRHKVAAAAPAAHAESTCVSASSAPQPSARPKEARLARQYSPRITASSRARARPPRIPSPPRSCRTSAAAYLGARSARGARVRAEPALGGARRRRPGRRRAGRRRRFAGSWTRIAPCTCSRVRDVEGRAHDRGREACARPRERGIHRPVRPSPTHGRPRPCGPCFRGKVVPVARACRARGSSSDEDTPHEDDDDKKAVSRDQCVTNVPRDRAPLRRGRTRARRRLGRARVRVELLLRLHDRLLAGARARPLRRRVPPHRVGALAARAVRLQADGELGEPERARAPRPAPPRPRGLRGARACALASARARGAPTRARARAAREPRVRRVPRRRERRDAARGSRARGRAASNGGVVAAILSLTSVFGVAGSWLARDASRAQLGGVALAAAGVVAVSGAARAARRRRADRGGASVRRAGNGAASALKPCVLELGGAEFNALSASSTARPRAARGRARAARRRGRREPAGGALS